MTIGEGGDLGQIWPDPACLPVSY